MLPDAKGVNLLHVNTYMVCKYVTLQLDPNPPSRLLSALTILCGCFWLPATSVVTQFEHDFARFKFARA